MSWGVRNSRRLWRTSGPAFLDSCLLISIISQGRISFIFWSFRSCETRRVSPLLNS